MGTSMDGLSFAYWRERSVVVALVPTETMSHRSFIDSVGRRWDVWTVKPENIERRSGTEATPTLERRRRREFRVPLGRKWSDGWLAFETDGDRRRLAPIPENWIDLDDATLERMCGAADRISRARRVT